MVRRQPEGTDPATPAAAPAGAHAAVDVRVVGSGGGPRRDRVAVEEPLEIRVVSESAGRRERVPLAVTMRTPGHDFELVAGFLLTEGVVTRASEIARLVRCEEDPAGNVVEAWLAPGVAFDPERHRRNLYAASSCGVCGKASLDRLEVALPAPIGRGPQIEPELLTGLHARLAALQPVFEATGGLHAAALFDAGGALLAVREDVGRHNALDKLLGERLMAEALPARESVLLLSGRTGFELVQKAAMGGIPVIAAVGAPSSLAVATARATGQTLVGFLRPDRFNVYSGAERLSGSG